MRQKRSKRIVAMMMALCIALLSLSPAGAVKVFAAVTELEPENLKQNGGGTTTAFKHFTQTRYKHNPTNSWVEAYASFDLEGIKDSKAIGSDKPYTDSGIQTTFSRRGYATVIGTESKVGGYETIDKFTNTYENNSNNYNGGVYYSSKYNVEVQLKTYPSEDEKWIIAEYVIYNRSKDVIENLFVGSYADVQIGNDDEAELYRTERGVRMVNSETLETFELITHDPKIGVNNPVSGEGGIQTWMGYYGRMLSSVFDHTDAPKYIPAPKEADSALSYSWKLTLRPYETVSRKVALGARGPSYYVSASEGNDTATGSYDDPLKTIEQAIKKIGNTVGYVYIQDYGEIDKTITVGDKQTITFMSADYRIDGSATDEIITLKRSSISKPGLLFQTGGVDATVRFSNIILDGNQQEIADNIYPLVQADKGTIGIQSGACLQNNQVSSKDVGSAINIIGSANLDINFGSISGNKSAERGAVYFGSTGAFTIKNEMNITGNTLLDGTSPANVYLARNKTIIITDSLEGEIGITTEELPDFEQDKAITIVSSTNPNSIANPSHYTEHFNADISSITGIYVTSEDNNIVLKRNGRELVIEYIDEDGLPVLEEVKKVYGPGDTVTVNALEITGSSLTGILLNPENIPSLSVETQTGKIAGNMPDYDVTITFQYEKLPSSIHFYANGGTPSPEALSGNYGDMVTAMMPKVSKYGYNFAGWYSNPDLSGDAVTNLPETYPLNPISYYAKWVPNQDINFNYIIRYINKNGEVAFARQIDNSKIVEDQIEAQAREIPAYTLIREQVSPERYENKLIGSFDEDTKDFIGVMPNQDVTVTYVYDVDLNQESNKKNLTVIYQTTSGRILKTVESRHFPEEAINAEPQDFYSYQLESKKVTKGHQANEELMLSAVSGSFDSNHIFTGKMPNQDVEIIYTYESTGEGFDFSVRYLYGGKDIRDSKIVSTAADTPVSTEFLSIYGYSYQEAWVNPAGYGDFDTTTYGYLGVMPNDDLTITYEYNKVADQWATLTYQAGANGTLTNTGAAEAVEAGSELGTYQAEIIRNDGSAAGATGAYTWADILQRNLVAVPVADEYYYFVDWFIDANGNGIIDEGEALTKDYRFTGDETVMAYFDKDPAWHTNIYFAAGVGGSLDAGQITSLYVRKNQVWSDIVAELPRYTPNRNYLSDGWHIGTNKVQGIDVLKEEQVYTIHFKKDPNIFGTNVQSPAGEGRVDIDGSGKLIVHGTTSGYQYIVADLDGKILAVQDGSHISDRLTFTKLSPGSRYLVYEAFEDVSVAVGSFATSLTNISAPSEILIPVVESNHYISFDENEQGKMKLVVYPADSKTDYGLLDMAGNVILTNKTNKDGWQTPSGSNPAIIEFTGLDYDSEYIIVGRPKNKAGVLPSHRIKDGTTIIANPGGEVRIPYYIVETIGGTIISVGDKEVNQNRYEKVEKGDIVQLSANQTDADGNQFKYWQVIVGGTKELSGKITDLEFEFVMPDNNVVISAYYNRTVTGTAAVEEEIRGGKENEIAVNPEEIPGLESELTTAADYSVINENDAKVVYKVIFNKNQAKTAEIKAIKNAPEYEPDHEEAFKAAWGLDIDLERYVNGRRASRATASNAVFEAIVQLEDSDIDMLDYQLYQMTVGEDGKQVATMIPFDCDPEATGGLFRFEAMLGGRYVLVYSRAYYVTFLNEIKSLAFPTFPAVHYLSFKVRRGQSVEGSYYEEYYSQLEEPIDTLIDNDGVRHDYVGWSTKNVPQSYKAFTLSSAIKQDTVVYAYYNNNRSQVIQKRNELENLIAEATTFSKNYFLTLAETNELLEAIAEAQEVFDMVDRKATYEELERGIAMLRSALEEKQKLAKDRESQYNDSKGSGNSGGHGNGGGSGSGTLKQPYQAKSSNTYVVGTNGQWVLTDAEGHQWVFELNGGLRLRSMWAYLEYTSGDLSKSGWYHFNALGIMDSGWFRDENFDWYYCDTRHDGWFGKMKTDWHYDETDKHWYYLDTDGKIATGWRTIDGKWYYFTAANSQNTYRYDESTGKWVFFNENEKPLGSMHKSGTTPDGYRVDDNGTWVQ